MKIQNSNAKPAIQHIQFPHEGFDLENGYLQFHGISLKRIIEQHGTPFRLMFLPIIRKRIEQARKLFAEAFYKYNYRGNYQYCYCTKCNHRAHVLHTVIEEGAHLETSSSLDIEIIRQLVQSRHLTQESIFIHNGYKTKEYLSNIIKLRRNGCINSITVIDSRMEIDELISIYTDIENPMKVGFRMATQEDSPLSTDTSRFGISGDDILDVYASRLADKKQFELHMLHFYVDNGIQDSSYYWNELVHAMSVYAKLKKQYPSLKILNIGGGFPETTEKGKKFDYAFIVDKIVSTIQSICIKEDIEEPDIYTEFGRFTVGESSALIFSVLEEKNQGINEPWYILDNSLMNTLPDIWSMDKRYHVLPINKHKDDYQSVNLGGISCDKSDVYKSNINDPVWLPIINKDIEEPLYVGFFHTGAYQEALSGYGGLKHCLIPDPKMIVIDENAHGEFSEYIVGQSVDIEKQINILGYK